MYLYIGNGIISENKSCLEISFCWKPGYFKDILWFVLESLGLGLSKYALRKGCYKCHTWAGKLPKNSIILDWCEEGRTNSEEGPCWKVNNWSKEKSSWWPKSEGHCEEKLLCE